MLTGYTYEARFLDLFAGSGGIGIEALSRYASHCTFVELAPGAVQCIKDNLDHTKLADRARVYKADALSFVSGLNKVDYDIIFMDPPYGRQLENSVLRELSCKQGIEDALIIVEAHIDEDMGYLDELGFNIIKEKKYKTNKHIFIRKRMDK